MYLCTYVLLYLFTYKLIHYVTEHVNGSTYAPLHLYTTLICTIVHS